MSSSHHHAYTGLSAVAVNPGQDEDSQRVRKKTGGGTRVRGPSLEVEPTPCDSCSIRAACAEAAHECDEFRKYLNGPIYPTGPRKSRARKGGRKYKISQEIVDAIRVGAAAGESGAALARKYGIDGSTARRIINGEQRS